MKVAAALASLAALLVAFAAAIVLAGCDSAVDDSAWSEQSAFSVAVEEGVAPSPDVPAPREEPADADSCSFVERMEALMRNLSTCWERDSYVYIVMDIVCPMGLGGSLADDIDGKLHTLVTCYGLEVLEADGSLWYRWPDEDTRQWAIDAAVRLGSGGSGGR